MVYLTPYPNVTFKVVAKSSFYDRAEFKDVSFSFLYNGYGELASATFCKNGNDVLCLKDIQKTDIAKSHYPNEHLGTELFIVALNEMISMWKMNPQRIDGHLSSADAQNHAWDISIPFYYDLPKYIEEYLHRSYTFHIYLDKERTQELRWEDFGSDLRSAAKAIRQQFEKTNENLYFSFLTSASN